MIDTLKLGIDLDGVIFNFGAAYGALINKHVPGSNLPRGFDTPSDWDWTDHLPAALVPKIWADIEATEDFWLTLNPIFHNATALYRFLIDNPEVEVYYVTSRTPSAGSPLLTQCSRALAQLGLLRDNTSVIPVSSGTRKGSIFGALGCQYSIDDRNENVVAAQAKMNKYGQPHRAYILTTTYNASFSGWRVSSLEDFLDVALANHRLKQYNETIERKEK